MVVYIALNMWFVAVLFSFIFAVFISVMVFMSCLVIFILRFTSCYIALLFRVSLDIQTFWLIIFVFSFSITKVVSCVDCYSTLELSGFSNVLGVWSEFSDVLAVSPSYWFPNLLGVLSVSPPTPAVSPSTPVLLVPQPLTPVVLPQTPVLLVPLGWFLNCHHPFH